MYGSSCPASEEAPTTPPLPPHHTHTHSLTFLVAHSQFSSQRDRKVWLCEHHRGVLTSLYRAAHSGPQLCLQLECSARASIFSSPTAVFSTDGGDGHLKHSRAGRFTSHSKHKLKKDPLLGYIMIYFYIAILPICSVVSNSLRPHGL